jgi:hypothetical protein
MLVEAETAYDGSQLSSLWAYRNYALQGDSIVAFTGPCKVSLDKMVDMADVLAGDFIYSEKMLHFIVEHFDLDLEKTVTRQRLLMAVINEAIMETAGVTVTRKGDDLFLDNRKLSVSIATLSPVSTLIHTGLNLSSRNTPVPTVSLPEIGVHETPAYANRVMEKYTTEIAGIRMARCKVRGVG